MSRTIRRIKNRKSNRNAPYANPRYWYREKDYCYWDFTVEIRSEKEMEENYWFYHGDKNVSWSYKHDWRNAEERRLRNQHRNQLIRWKKNPDHEILLDKPYCLSWYF